MEDCIFCKIVRGELPSVRLYEDDATLAILTIEPVATGHTLVISKQHARNIFEVTPDVWARVQETVRKITVAIEKSLRPDGANLTMNNREVAGQVIDHVHVHIIPRKKGDGLKPWPHHPRRENEAEPIAEKIRAAL